MDLPLPLIIDNIERPGIYHFKDIKHDPNAPPHFYIVIPLSNGVNLLLCIITSKIDKKKQYYSKVNNAAISSLVSVNNTILHFLTKDSIIECNQPEIISKRDLLRRVEPDSGFKRIEQDIPLELINNIKNAIQNSPMVEPYIKKAIRNI